MNKRRISLIALVTFLTLAANSTPKKNFLKTYKDIPYRDSRYSAGPQGIPGMVQCAYYDLGGEGVAYHDSDAKK